MTVWIWWAIGTVGAILCVLGGALAAKGNKWGIVVAGIGGGLVGGSVLGAGGGG